MNESPDFGEAMRTTPGLVTQYWEMRYSTGKTSGEGSRGQILQDKAAEINALIRKEQINSVIDWGCGDGQLTELLICPDYLGIDVSRTAVGIGLLRFGHHQFLKWNPHSGIGISVRGELALSVDVIFHLTDDATYERYLDRLFASATRYVLVYSTDAPQADEAPHVRHRSWTGDVPPPWELIRKPKELYGRWLWRKPGAELK